MQISIMQSQQHNPILRNTLIYFKWFTLNGKNVAISSVCGRAMNYYNLTSEVWKRVPGTSGQSTYLGTVKKLTA